MKTLDRGINETELMIALVVEKTSRTRKNERTKEREGERRGDADMEGKGVSPIWLYPLVVRF